MREYFLKTDRLLFSYWSDEDLDLADLLWGEDAVSKYITKSGIFSKAEIKSRLILEINNQKNFHVQYWPIFEKETCELIGCCGFRPYDIDRYVYELGFHLRSKYWGKGLATEAAATIIKYAIKNMTVSELIAGHNPNNTNSKKVLQKLGFQYIGDIYYEPTNLYHPAYKYSVKTDG